jgi:amino acid transporter
LNGVLAQIVMASRVLFGLGRRSDAFAIFHRSHARFGTPVLGTVLVGAVVIVSALTLPVAALAELTTFALLVVFAIVNGALIGLKRRAPKSPFAVWAVVPWFGLLACIVAFAAAMAAAFGVGS